MNSAIETKKNLKCVVWDLDHTLWSGVLVEGDELVLKPEIVDVIKALDAKGVLQSVASKNNFEDAAEKIEQFGLSDYFLYPQISWNPKSSAIATIRDKLNIGIDTFLFIDDQPFERDEVQALHPEVECLDAEDYLALLTHARIANISLTDDVAQRRIRYLEDMKRQTDEQDFEGTPESFLAGFDMVFTIAPAQPEDLLPAEELTERTNQLNSTGITYDKPELSRYMQSPDHELLVCELQDKYGSYGKIGLALVEIGASTDLLKLLLMSCRTAARGVGSVLLSYLMKQAQQRQHTLQAQFKRTSRNRQMLVTYQFANVNLKTSFKPYCGRFLLDIYRFFLNICPHRMGNTAIASNNRKKPLNLSAISILATGLIDFLRFKEIERDDEGNILFENNLSLVSDYPEYIQVVTE